MYVEDPVQKVTAPNYPQKQTVDPAASDSDTLKDSAVTACTIHVDYEEELQQHDSRPSSTPKLNGCDLILSTRKQISEQA